MTRPITKEAADGGCIILELLSVLVFKTTRESITLRGSPKDARNLLHAGIVAGAHYFASTDDNGVIKSDAIPGRSDWRKLPDEVLEMLPLEEKDTLPENFRRSIITPDNMIPGLLITNYSDHSLVSLIEEVSLSETETKIEHRYILTFADTKFADTRLDDAGPRNSALKRSPTLVERVAGWWKRTRK